MRLDLGRMMFRKQERESARLDGFDWARRTRHVALVADWVRRRGGAGVDPAAEAARLARVPPERIFAELRLRLSPAPLEADWTGVVAALALLADAETRIEQGDPAPHRLA